MRLFIFFFLLSISFCNKLGAEEIYQPKSHCFINVSTDESKSEWAKEYKLGVGFAGNLEYSNAIYCFKRALLLCPKDSPRTSEIEYAILLANYFGHNYQEVIRFFESHSLLYVDTTFKAYHDLMIILFHCYEITKERAKADLIMERIEALSPVEANQMKLTGAIIRRDFDSAQKISEKTSHKELIESLSQSFYQRKKSVSLAKWLNVLVPGMGYFYLGQKKAALTSFLLNGVLIIGAAQLFLNHYYTLGGVVALLEIGWYAGGIYGAKHTADLYNENLFANFAEKVFYHESLSPENKLYYEF